MHTSPNFFEKKGQKRGRDCSRNDNMFRCFWVTINSYQKQGHRSHNTGKCCLLYLGNELNLLGLKGQEPYMTINLLVKLYKQVAGT